MTEKEVEFRQYLDDLRERLDYEMRREFVLGSWDKFAPNYLPWVPLPAEVTIAVEALLKARCQHASNGQENIWKEGLGERQTGQWDSGKKKKKKISGAAALLETKPVLPVGTDGPEGSKEAKSTCLEGQSCCTPKQKPNSDQPPTVLCYTEDGLRFSMFNGRPSSYGLTVEETYKHLQDIVDVISNLDLPGRTRNRFTFRFAIASEMEASKNMIDACLTSDGDGLTTAGIVVTFVFKLNCKRADIVDNNAQSVSANSQIMNDDPRRMFTFAITIEDDKMTVWYHSRSHSALCEPFSFMEGPKRLISLVISLLFASEEQLGYDPTVVRQPGPDGYYIYKLPQGPGKPSRWYRTTRTVSEDRSLNITGRITRVWEVGEIVSPTDTTIIGPLVALKDVWLDASADTEKEIQNAIFNSIDEFWKSTSAEADPRLAQLDSEDVAKLATLARSGDYKKLFLEIGPDYVGKTSKPVPPGFTPKTDLLERPLASSPVETKTQRAAQANVTPRPLEPHTAVKNTDPPREYAPKRQYRVIYTEVCTSVGDLLTVGEVMEVLEQTLIALQLFYCAGWVHRDISSGNILAYKQNVNDPWKAKLADLEYTKRYPTPSDHIPGNDPKTGTPFFMANEILSSKPLWDSNFSKPSEKDPSKKIPSSYKERRKKLKVDATDPPKEIIAHNFEHDLESLWWISVWTVTYRLEHQAANAFSKRIFINTLSLGSDRDTFFRGHLQRLDKLLTGELLPLAQSLDLLREDLQDGYITREQTGQVFDVGSYSWIHSQFVQFFKDLPDEKWQWADVALTPSHSLPDTTDSDGETLEKPAHKRQRDDGEYQPEDGEEEDEDESPRGSRSKRPNLKPLSKQLCPAS